MIAFFPEIYPDELLYSQLARYHSRSGYARYAFSVADLYKNDTTVHPDVEFVNQYTPDAMNWITKHETWESVLTHHTMYPAYIRFLPQVRRNNAVNGLTKREGNWKNLMCLPVSKEKRYIRYCPVCSGEDRRKYGETYWHREHQIQKIRVCPKHSCYLENSEIEISAKMSPGLHDAESLVPEHQEPRMCENCIEIEFTQYVIDVFREPIDLNNPLPVGTFLHSRLNSDYVNSSGLVRNISKLYEDYLALFGKDMPTMTQSYMQKIYNGYHHDPYFVLQLAFFEKISVQKITHLPTDLPLYGIENTYWELSQKYNLDYATVAEIGSAVLKYSYNQTRVSRKTGPRGIMYDELDAQYLPQVKKVVLKILTHTGRPEKVSFAKVQKTLGLPQKQFNKLPKCKAYIEEHIETQAEYWAREVEWAIGELEREDRPLNCTRIMKLTNMRIRDIECCCPYIKNPKIKFLISIMLSPA